MRVPQSARVAGNGSSVRFSAASDVVCRARRVSGYAVRGVSFHERRDASHLHREQAPIALIVKVLAIKVVVGMVVGFAIDAVLHAMRRDKEHLRIHELCERDNCHCNGDCKACGNNPELAYDFEHDKEHDHDHEGGSIVKSALKHTAQVTLFIFLVTLALEW
ncbi:MAG: hypothetical protein ACLT98_07150 [Eggerthellaceae bacterium]